MMYLFIFKLKKTVRFILGAFYTCLHATNAIRKAGTQYLFYIYLYLLTNLKFNIILDNTEQLRQYFTPHSFARNISTIFV